VTGPAADARRVRTRNGHTHRADAGHRGSCSMAGTAPRMRSIVVRAMPVSRCTSLFHRPASIAARTTPSRRLPTAACSAAQAVSICLACRTVSPVTLRMLHLCSTYCNTGASPGTGRPAARACGHGSRKGTGRSAGPAAGRGAGIIAPRPADTKDLGAGDRPERQRDGRAGSAHARDQRHSGHPCEQASPAGPGSAGQDGRPNGRRGARHRALQQAGRDGRLVPDHRVRGVQGPGPPAAVSGEPVAPLCQ